MFVAKTGDKNQTMQKIFKQNILPAKISQSMVNSTICSKSTLIHHLSKLFSTLQATKKWSKKNYHYNILPKVQRLTKIYYGHSDQHWEKSWHISKRGEKGESSLYSDWLFRFVLERLRFTQRRERISSHFHFLGLIMQGTRASLLRLSSLHGFHLSPLIL